MSGPYSGKLRPTPCLTAARCRLPRPWRIWRSFRAGSRIRGEGKAGGEGASHPETRGSYQIGGGGERSGLRQVRVKSEACIAGRKSAYIRGSTTGKLISRRVKVGWVGGLAPRLASHLHPRAFLPHSAGLGLSVRWTQVSLGPQQGAARGLPSFGSAGGPCLWGQEEKRGTKGKLNCAHKHGEV